jgi:hypothetical protein
MSDHIPGELRQCPQCLRAWPRKAEHDLRSFRWLMPLPRLITPSNGDMFLHDGAGGRDRFLLLEAKMPWEPPLQSGQRRLLEAAARQPGWTVRILSGTLARLEVFRVTASGVEGHGSTVRPDDFRASVVSWINGSEWKDPRAVRGAAPVEPGEHICGWGRVGEVWRCVQDYYAAGSHPASSCGATWEPAA